MVVLIDEARTVWSPSPRRAWIEMSVILLIPILTVSPSPRRAWIEIYRIMKTTEIQIVALPTEGVD